MAKGRPLHALHTLKGIITLREGGVSNLSGRKGVQPKGGRSVNLRTLLVQQVSRPTLPEDFAFKRAAFAEPNKTENMAFARERSTNHKGKVFIESGCCVCRPTKYCMGFNEDHP